MAAAPDDVVGRLAFVVTRPVAITMFILALGVFGVVSFLKLPVDLLPEISYPTLTVRTAYPGAAPEDVEDRVSTRLQEALSTLPGLVRTSSVSRAGFSDVVLEFDWGTGMTFAVQEVRDRIDGVFLPSGAERPLILRYGAGDWNALHQDLYGDVFFPFQALTVLTDAHEGGEFVLLEQRPRAQSRAHVLRPPRGAFVLFPTRERPNAGRNGHHRVGMRHGVSTVTAGSRTALGVIFHDAR